VLSTDLPEDGSLLAYDYRYTVPSGLSRFLTTVGKLDRMLVGRWHFLRQMSVRLTSLTWTESSSPYHNIHVVKFGTGTLDEDLVEQIWGLCSS